MTGAAWTLHWLEAEGDLQPWRECIEAEMAAARDAVARSVPPPRLDILIQHLPGRVIPETGMGGTSYGRCLMALTIDPANAAFAPSLAGHAFRRMAVHEVHHCLRFAATGYGGTLGEALVSEGLAGQFVHALFGNPPDPWECAVDDAVLRAHLPTSAELASTAYGHDAWFYGAGGRYPRWLGYTLGYRIVGEWLARGSVDGSRWVDVSAADVLAAATTVFADGPGGPVLV